jgi:CRP/FNR family transcriptional regulator
MAHSVQNVRPAMQAATVISIRDLQTRCSRCGIREMCLPVGLDADALRKLDGVVTARTRVRKGQAVYRAGDAFTALYAIRLGTCKTMVLASDGREQISGYHLVGDLLGLDGIAHERHECHAVALEDTEVCVMPFDHLEELARAVAPLQHNLHRFLSREIGREQHLMLMLGSMRAEARLAAFLLNLADRYRMRGYASTEFVLRMTREEIGSYLGLKLETVSRLFSRFHAEGLLQVHARTVSKLDLPALRTLAGIC